MLLSALFAVAVVLEAFLFIGKDWLPDARRRSELAASVRQAHADLKESQKRVADARARLMAAVDAAEHRRSALREADEAFAKSQRVLPTLVHVLGDVNVGGCFRAPIAKALPANAEVAQLTLWGCNNVVDVWAGDLHAARTLAARQFPPKRGYTLGDFVEIQPPAAAEPRQAAA